MADYLICRRPFGAAAAVGGENNVALCCHLTTAQRKVNYSYFIEPQTSKLTATIERRAWKTAYKPCISAHENTEISQNRTRDELINKDKGLKSEERGE